MPYSVVMRIVQLSVALEGALQQLFICLTHCTGNDKYISFDTNALYVETKSNLPFSIAWNFRVYNNIVKVSELALNSNYHLFKQGIRPEWEDAANEKGGKWVIQFPRTKTGEEINKYWLNTVFTVIIFCAKSYLRMSRLS